MMLACNSFFGVMCGYVQNVSDAYLFARINNGNAISYPLGVNWGWATEINLKETFRTLFCEPFGNGYPVSDAKRKRQDSERLHKITEISKKNIIEVLPLIDEDIVQGTLHYDIVYNFIMENGTNDDLKTILKRSQR